MARLGWTMDKYRKMKKVTIEELQEGDEIIIASGSKLKYLKVLKNPALSDKKGWMKSVDDEGYFKLDNNAAKYKALLCSNKVEEVTYKFKGWQGAPDRFKTYKSYIFEPDIEKHNKRVSIDLNNKDILLVKRKEI